MTVKAKNKGSPPDKSRTDVSLDDVRDMIYNALQERDKDSWLNQVYGSYIIYEKDGKYFKLSYSILEGEVQLGSEATEVERVWVEAQGQIEKMPIKMNGSLDPEGISWDVTICEPGITKHADLPWYLPEKVLKESAQMFEGVDVFLYEVPDKGATHADTSLYDIKSLLIKNKAGWIENAQYVFGQGIKAVLNFVDSYKYLGRNLLDAKNKGAEIYGLSYDTSVLARFTKKANKTVKELVKFLDISSVDIVTRPAAGGKFNRAIAAHNAKEDIMDKEKLWAMISEKRPDLLEGKEMDKITDEEIVELARMAMEPPEGAKSKAQSAKRKDGDKPPEPGDGGKGGDTNNQDVVKKDDLAKFRCEMALEKKLADADLIPELKENIQERFKDRIFGTEELDSAIGKAKDLQAKMSEPQGGDDNDAIPSSNIHVGIGTLEKAQMAVDRLFGLTKDDVEGFARMETLDNQPFFMERVGTAGFHVRNVQDMADYDQVPAFRSLREMYSFFTGDTEVTGFFNRKKLSPGLRAKMDITSSTFTYVLGNTMGRRLVKVYKEADYLEKLLISVRKAVKDFRQQEAVLVGGFPDLADVDPEAADYDEIAAVTDEESTYTLGQKGNILTITRKTIINDDLSIIGRLVNGIGRAARRTHGQYVWDMYIDNDNCTDGTAVFTGGHGNLGAMALSHTTALVAWKALAAMTEKDSGKYLGLLDGADVVVNLIGPPALKELIGRIEKEQDYFTSNDVSTKIPNPLFGEVKGHALSLLAADANDWLMLLPPEITELIEMGYLNGREEPEMFVADSPQSEQVFVADKIRHKIRHEYAGTPIDYRGAYKAEVA